LRDNYNYYIIQHIKYLDNKVLNLKGAAARYYFKDFAAKNPVKNHPEKGTKTYRL